MVRAQLIKLNPQKATGPDELSPLVLKKCADVLAAPLATLFNNCLSANVWPSSWKSSSIIPVHKKGSKALLSNYRPVALLSVLSKVFEKIIHANIYNHLKENKLICRRQFGFLKQRSAADLHLLMSSKWAKALDDGLQTLVVAVDIEGAFDRVWHRGLIAKLESLGISGDLLELLKN